MTILSVCCTEMCGIMMLRKQNSKERPLGGAKIACCTHVTAQTAVSEQCNNEGDLWIC